MVALAMLLAVAGGTRAYGQIFQYEYGGTREEAGRGGVRAVTSEGGYVAVGESFTPSGLTSDIYLLRTNGDGSRLYSYTYNIGGNDSALDIEEVVTNGSFDGFIITGVTDNIDPYGCGRTRDIFLLRVDRCGKVMWVNTYGSHESDEIGYDVEVMDNGDNCGGNAGDFVVVGSTCFPGRPRDGYIIRVKDAAPANLIWTRRHNSPCDGDDYWYGVAEAIVAADGGVPGDLIVVGGSDGFCNTPGRHEAVIAHFNGCAENPNVFPYGIGVYGEKYDDDLRSVIELSDGPYRGTFVATGRTEIADVAGVVSPEVYVIQTRAWPCRRVDDLTLGDQGSRPDEGYWVREVKTPHPDAGSVIITGYMTLPGGFGGADAFLQRITPTGLGLAPVAPVTRVFGGQRDDWGWSVDPVYADAAGCYSDGYIMTGFTYSFVGDQQLYLVKTNLNLKSGCNDREADAREKHPGYKEYCFDMRIDKFGNECRPKIERICQKWETRLCYDKDGTNGCVPRPCDCFDAIFKLRFSDDAEIVGTTEVSTYPNPIASGSLLSLEYTLAAEGKATVVVSDLIGNVIYANSANHDAGLNTVSVSTSGWSVGVYMVQVTIGEKSQTRRIIVTDK